MKIRFYAHASFRLEGNGVAIVTDPYTPGPDVSNFEPISEAADIVIMSSATDRFHSDPTHVGGEPVVINAVEVPAGGVTVKGVHFQALQTMESLTFDYVNRDPDYNAMYYFTLEGIRCFHMGDLGNPVEPAHLEAMRDQVDVMFALTGGHATIALDDLQAAVSAIGPRIVIPMHYYSPKGRLKIHPVTEFTARYPAEQVTFVQGCEIELMKGQLPEKLQIIALEQSR
jgi:L-ascorbate metabolism protein UlaG (beta-lactamase superfamily)